MSSTSAFSFATPYPPSVATAAQAATAAISANATGTSAMSSQASNAATLKQRRVSLALPNSPRLFSTWNFRDDTTIDAHGASSGSSFAAPSQPASQNKDKSSDKDKDKDKKGKMRKASPTANADAGEETRTADKQSGAAPEKRQRKKWTEEETQMLVTGCNIVRVLF